MKMYKLLGADGKEYLSGSYEKARVFFADEKTALAAGYRPCGNCLRKQYQEYMENPQKYREKFGV